MTRLIQEERAEHKHAKETFKLKRRQINVQYSNILPHSQDGDPGSAMKCGTRAARTCPGGVGALTLGLAGGGRGGLEGGVRSHRI